MRELPSFLVATSCYIAIILLSWGSAFPAPTSQELLNTGLLNKKNFAIFASISHIAALAPFLLIVFFVKKPEIKILVVIGSALGTVAWYLIASADSAAYLIVAMTLIGIQNGLILTCLPGYLSEIVLDNRKTFYNAVLGFMFRIGVLLVYLMGIWVSFRWLAIIALVLELILVLIMLTNPYSPAWLVQKNLSRRAKGTLLYLHGEGFDADQEIENIKGRMVGNRENWCDALKALREWKYLKTILIVSVLVIFKEAGGHEAMVTFSSHILEVQTSLQPRVAALCYPISLIIGGLTSISIVNHCNLKVLLMLTTLFQALSHLSMSVYFFVSVNYFHCVTAPHNHICTSLAFWPIANIAFYAFSFSLGWGTIIFIIFGRMFTAYQEISFIIIVVVTGISSYVTVVAFFFMFQFAGGLFAFLPLFFVLIAATLFQYLFLDL